MNTGKNKILSVIVLEQTTEQKTNILCKNLFKVLFL